MWIIPKKIKGWPLAEWELNLHCTSFCFEKNTCWNDSKVAEISLNMFKQLMFFPITTNKKLSRMMYKLGRGCNIDGTSSFFDDFSQHPKNWSIGQKRIQGCDFSSMLCIKILPGFFSNHTTWSYGSNKNYQHVFPNIFSSLFHDLDWVCWPKQFL